MSLSPTFYRSLGVVLTVCGSLLIVLGLAETVIGVSIFDDSPYLVGAGVGAIGVALVAGNRRTDRTP